MMDSSSGPGSGSGSGSGPGSRHLDPHRVYELVIRRRPQELLNYLHSVPAYSSDLHGQGIALVGKALQDLISQPQIPHSGQQNEQIRWWAELAQYHAERFCAPMVDNLSITSDAEIL